MSDEPREHILLKWGTVKGWKFSGDSPAYQAALRWEAEGVTAGAMQQQDTPTQKQALCDWIDALDGPIRNDWSGEEMTKEEAKAYVMEYGT